MVPKLRCRETLDSENGPSLFIIYLFIYCVLCVYVSVCVHG